MLGYHFALSAEQERRLVAASDADDQDKVAGVMSDIEENDWYTDDLRVGSDKAWDAIHRCLGDESLDPAGGEYPLTHAILGGRDMHDDYYICYLTADQVGDVAAALHEIDESWLRRRYDQIHDDYRRPRDAEDFAYTWGNFVDIRSFYDRAAAAGRAVIFTAT